MSRSDQTLALLVILVASNVLCDDIFEPNHRDDPCVALCEKLPLLSLKDQYEKLCCQRGCRFFNLADLYYDLVNNLNTSMDACESSCSEAYKVVKDRTVCELGCNFMAAQRVADFTAFLPADAAESDVPVMSPDVPENDAMTDPDLRKELLPGWWDTDFKLPQTFVKSVAKDTDSMVDYGGSSVYSVEMKESAASNVSYWLRCGSRHNGVPGWVVHCAMALVAIAVFWLRFAANGCLKEESIATSAPVGAQKQNVASKLIILIPDEMPLRKTPPPKYSEIADVDDVNFKQ